MKPSEVLRIANDVQEKASKLSYCGYDPYDVKAVSLLSKVSKIRYVSFLQDRVLSLTPTLIRKAFGVRPSVNSKALALFALGCCNLYEYLGDSEWLRTSREIIGVLERTAVSHESGIGWAYPFDWQSRVFFPAGTPSGVVTSFVLKALIRWTTLAKGNDVLPLVRKAADFLAFGLNINQIDSNRLCFSYTPLDRFYVHNANVLVASALMTADRVFPGQHYPEKAIRAFTYTMKEQKKDGSWDYFGSHENLPGGIDNYHTGFVLESLNDYYLMTSDAKLREGLLRGLEYYLEHLFFDGYLPRFNSKLRYPVDIHGCADSIIVLTQLDYLKNGLLDRAEKLLDWTISKMYDGNGGFYYQVYPAFTSRAVFMRWNNAWMFYALTEYLKAV